MEPSLRREAWERRCIQRDQVAHNGWNHRYDDKKAGDIRNICKASLTLRQELTREFLSHRVFWFQHPGQLVDFAAQSPQEALRGGRLNIEVCIFGPFAWLDKKKWGARGQRWVDAFNGLPPCCLKEVHLRWGSHRRNFQKLLWTLEVLGKELRRKESVIGRLTKA